MSACQSNIPRGTVRIFEWVLVLQHHDRTTETDVCVRGIRTKLAFCNSRNCANHSDRKRFVENVAFVRPAQRTRYKTSPSTKTPSGLALVNSILIHVILAMEEAHFNWNLGQGNQKFNTRVRSHKHVMIDHGSDSLNKQLRQSALKAAADRYMKLSCSVEKRERERSSEGVRLLSRTKWTCNYWFPHSIACFGTTWILTD